MIFKIDGAGGAKATDKAKAKSKAGATGGPSFASLLEEAQHAGEVESAAIGGGIGVAGGFVPIEEELPRDAKGQARELLKTLQELTGDALGGTPTGVASKLQALAESAAEDAGSLTEAQKKALNEVRTRAAVEVEKLKS